MRALTGPRPQTDYALVCGLTLLSTVLLSYEITQLRVFAYSLSPVLTYAAISITMLGFGVASTVLSLSRRLQSAPLGPACTVCCVLMALVGVVANFAFAQASPRILLGPGLAGTFTAATLAVILLCMLPYAFGGLAISLVLSRRSAESSRLYFANLLGSGLGCFSVTFALRPLGAERLIFLLLAGASLSGALLAGRKARTVRTLAVVVGGLLIALVPSAPRLLTFSPDASDQFAQIAQGYRRAGLGEPIRELSSWDPVGKLEIHSWHDHYANAPAPIGYKLLTHDGGAASVLFAVGDDPLHGARLFGNTMWGVAFQLRPHANVLIIGLGGGPDVLAALFHHEARITGVEINASIIDAVRSTFAPFLGDPYAQPGVRIVLSDGRSFVRRTDERYDVVQLSGVDTLTTQSSGSFVLAEDYLYTVEAFKDYLNVLNENGILLVTRFGPEPIRLSMIAERAFKELGVPRLDQHIVILRQSSASLVLIKRSAWTREELATLDRMVNDSEQTNQGLGLLASDLFNGHFDAPLRYLYAPHQPDAEPHYAALFGSIAADQAPKVTVPTDDSPYYFSASWVAFLRGEPISSGTAGVLGVHLHFTLILVSVALICILIPPALQGSRSLPRRHRLPIFAYFFALGFCYMFLEIGLIQKAVLVVEHPAYSVAVVLAALLIASAIGSLLVQRVQHSPRAVVGAVAGAITVIGVTYVVLLGTVFDALMPFGFPVRITAVVLIVALLGLPMGMLFPIGLRQLTGSDAAVIPWAIAVNGLASVIGSVLSLPFAVLYGFNALFACGVAVYVVGCGAFLWLPPRTAEALDRSVGDIAQPAIAKV